MSSVGGTGSDQYTPGSIQRGPTVNKTSSGKSTDTASVDTTSAEYWKNKIASDQEIYNTFSELFKTVAAKGDVAAMLIAYQASKAAKFDLDIDQQQADLVELQRQQAYINNLNVRVQGFAESAQNYMTNNKKSDVKGTPFENIGNVMSADPASIQASRDKANIFEEGLNIALGIFNTDATKRKQSMVNWNDTKAWKAFSKAHPEESKQIFNLAKSAGLTTHAKGMTEYNIGKAKDGVQAIIDGLRSSANATEDAMNAGGGISLSTLETIAPKYQYSMDQLKALYKDSTGKYNGLTNALTNIAKGIDNAIQNGTTQMQQLVSRQNAFTDVMSSVLKSIQSSEQATGRNV